MVSIETVCAECGGPIYPDQEFRLSNWRNKCHTWCVKSKNLTEIMTDSWLGEDK